MRQDVSHFSHLTSLGSAPPGRLLHEVVSEHWAEHLFPYYRETRRRKEILYSQPRHRNDLLLSKSERSKQAENYLP